MIHVQIHEWQLCVFLGCLDFLRRGLSTAADEGLGLGIRSKCWGRSMLLRSIVNLTKTTFDSASFPHPICSVTVVSGRLHPRNFLAISWDMACFIVDLFYFLATNKTANFVSVLTLSNNDILFRLPYSSFLLLCAIQYSLLVLSIKEFWQRRWNHSPRHLLQPREFLEELISASLSIVAHLTLQHRLLFLTIVWDPIRSFWL